MTFLRLMVTLSLVALAVLFWQLLPTPVEHGKPAPAAAAPTRFAILDARVFDGETLWPRASVQVADGRIEAIGESLEVPEGYARIDGAGRTLLPGLIDAHVHTWGEARRDALRFGVTTMLDMFTDHRQLAAARAERESLAAMAQADLWSAGTLATAAGGHGTQFGMDVPTLAAAEEASAWVAARKAEGSDWIKLVREDLHTYSETQRLPTLDDATAAAVIAAAHAQGLMALAHVSGLEEARAALRDGADGLVHVFSDSVADEDFVQQAQARGVFVVPTLTVIAGMAGERSVLADDARIADFLSPGQKQTLGASFGGGRPAPALIATARENVRRLHEVGVVILAGSDAPNPNTAHGASIHDELAQLVQAGLHPLEALAAATSRSADAFSLADRGRIAAGKRADLLLVEGDPSLDINATRAIATIWKNGHPVERRLEAAAPAPVLEAGGIGSFDGEALDSGWEPTSDRIAGGQSDAVLARIAGGAGGSAGAMRVSGRVAAGAAWPWAGALYSPGAQAMQPVDASSLRELVFQVRGDGREYAALLFAGEGMGMPAVRGFATAAQWREVRLPLADFAGADLAQLRALGWTAGMPAGEFWFEIDAVELR